MMTNGYPGEDLTLGQTVIFGFSGIKSYRFNMSNGNVLSSTYPVSESIGAAFHVCFLLNEEIKR